MPYRTQKLTPPRAPRPLVKGGRVLLALLGVICSICLAASHFGRV